MNCREIIRLLNRSLLSFIAHCHAASKVSIQHLRHYLQHLPLYHSISIDIPILRWRPVAVFLIEDNPADYQLRVYEAKDICRGVVFHAVLRYNSLQDKTSFCDADWIHQTVFTASLVISGRLCGHNMERTWWTKQLSRTRSYYLVRQKRYSRSWTMKTVWS